MTDVQCYLPLPESFAPQAPALVGPGRAEELVDLHIIRGHMYTAHPAASPRSRTARAGLVQSMAAPESMWGAEDSTGKATAGPGRAFLCLFLGQGY